MRNNGLPSRSAFVRAVVPAESKGLYVAPGTDGSLAIYSEAAFARLADQLAEGSPTAQDVRAFSRLFFAQAQYAEMDGQGRVRIPPELAALAELTNEVVMVGVRDHLELWNSERWDSYLKARQSQYDEIAEKAFGKGGRWVTHSEDEVKPEIKCVLSLFAIARGRGSTINGHRLLSQGG